jgi:hypothetical protein
MSAALAQPWAGVVLSGAVTVDTLRSNLGASPSLWDDDLAGLVEPAEVYWAERSRRSWT